MILYPGNKYRPSALVHQWHGLIAGDLRFSIADDVTQMYVKDRVETGLVELFEESQLVLVSDPWF